MKRLNSRGQLRCIHGGAVKRFHAFAQGDFFRFGGKTVPVLQLCTARSELGQFCIEQAITVVFDNGLGLVPEAVRMA